MMQKAKKIIALLLCLMMVLSLAACGDKNNDDNGGGKKKPTSSSEPNDDPNGGQHGNDPFDPFGHNDPNDPGNNDPNQGDPVYDPNKDRPVDNNFDVKAKIYHVGDDVFVLSLTGKDVSKFTNTTLYLEFTNKDQDPDGNVEITCDTWFNARLTTKSGDHSYDSSPVEGLNTSNGILYLKGSASAVYQATIEGLWNMMPNLQENFTLKSPYGDLLASGKTSDFVSVASEADIAEIMTAAYNEVQVDTKPMKEWEGEWMSGAYADDSVYLSVKVLDGGLIRVSGIANDKQIEYYLKESEFQKSQEEIRGNASLYRDLYSQDQRFNNSVSLSYSSYYWDGKFSEPQLGFSSTIRLNDNNDEYVNATLSKVNGTWHGMPADYKDEDILGAFSRPADAGDAEFFTPLTDDYMLTFIHNEKGMSFYTNSDTTFTIYDTVRLISFNKNGYGLAVVEKNIFTSAAEAKQAYDIVTANQSQVNYKVYNIKDNVVYITYDSSNYYGDYNTSYTKKGELEKYASKWYLGAHFLYDTNMEGYYKYTYFSKPYTTVELDITPLQMVFWHNKDWHVYCKDNDVYWLRNHIDSYYFDLEVEVESESAARELPGYHLWSGANAYVRYTGESLKGIRASYRYDDEGNRHHVMVVNDYAIIGNEITLTQYIYDVDNPFTEEVTLDNYKTVTPRDSGTYTFEIKVKEDRY